MASTTRISFPSGALTLEGALYQPDGGPARAAVVVCHPHPQFGGDMHNNVVQVVAAALTSIGITALVFNFRGVGASEGEYDNGAGEADDARAALDYARALPGVETVALAGYSFGARVAASIAEASISRLCLVALPARNAAPDLSGYPGLVLLVSGDQDGISPADAIRDLATALGQRAEAVIVPGADHGWWGHEGELEAAVRRFFEPTAEK